MNLYQTVFPLSDCISVYEPSPRSQIHWGQPQFAHDYHGHYDMHRGHSFKTQGGARQMSSADYGGRDWKVTSPAR